MGWAGLRVSSWHFAKELQYFTHLGFWNSDAVSEALQGLWYQSPDWLFRSVWLADWVQVIQFLSPYLVWTSMGLRLLCCLAYPCCPLLLRQANRRWHSDSQKTSVCSDLGRSHVLLVVLVSQPSFPATLRLTQHSLTIPLPPCFGLRPPFLGGAPLYLPQSCSRPSWCLNLN